MRVRCDPDGINKASRVLSAGGVVVFPTDTVYGVGCDPFDGGAVARVYRVKKRSPEKMLPVLAYSKEAAEEIAIFDSNSERVADRMWPGALTLILDLSDERLMYTLNVADKIAVRVPDHRCTLELLKQCRYVVGTSANISGTGSATDPAECEKMGGYDLLLDGGVIPGGNESTIIEFIDGKLKVHREGQVKEEEIVRIL